MYKLKANFTIVFLLMLAMIPVVLGPMATMHAQTSMPSPAFRAFHINSNTTTNVSTVPGILHTIVINKAGASSNTVTVYDGVAATGSVIAVIDGTMAANYLQYDVQYNTSLTIVTATGTAPDITITYRP